MKLISQNPYRVLGVLSNSPLKERVGNQNRLAAFAKVGKEVEFPNDFATIIKEKPIRTTESISSANIALNLDKDQLKYALFWFINGSPIDDIAIKNIQAGNLEKAHELFEKKETFSSLINLGVLHLISGIYASGFTNISRVIHNNGHRSSLLKALGIENLTMTEDEIAAMYIEEMLSEVPASTLLSSATTPDDKALISKKALEEPISVINQAVAAAKSIDAKDADANLQAGTKLMNSTKAALKQVKEIAGATSPQYQMVADNVAKTVLQCGINYYNNAPDSDVESPRKAMVLQAYALEIAVGQFAKQRCKENVDVLKKAIDNMPPAEVAIEARKVTDELRKFCKLPDEIKYSINLLNATKPLLQKIKSKLGATNTFYLSLSTQVVANALHNLIEEVNQTQKYVSTLIDLKKQMSVLNPARLNHLGDEHSPAKIIDNELKPVLRQAWKATTIMDSFDMEADFEKKRYSVNRKSLKEMCDGLGISTSTPISIPKMRTQTRTSTIRPTSTQTTTNRSTTSSNSLSSSSNDDSMPVGCWVAIIIAIIIILILALG